MDETKTKTRIVLVCLVWFGILGLVWLGWKFWWAPAQKELEVQKVEEEQKQTIVKTSAAARFKHQLTFAADSFSGYAPIRSADFQEECSSFGIRVDLIDDGADYPKRMKSLAEGKTQMAVFAWDACVKASAGLGDMPVVVIFITDESKGADAVVASKTLFPDLDSLNVPGVKFVCVADSPSETVVRVVMANFNLDQIGDQPFEFVANANEVWNAYKKTGANEKKVFVTWEPYVSKMVDNPEYHAIIDSSKFRGYIVDVVVVQRSFLLKNEEVVENVTKAYFTTVFKHRNDMNQLVADDARQLGEVLKPEQVERLCKTIWWKNTQENYGHFGFTTGHIQHLDSIHRNILGVLQRTGAITQDPSNGQPNLWYYDKIMRKLFDTGWYPGFGQESVREEKSLLALSDEEWTSLRPIGTLQIPRLVFARGTSRLTDASNQTLDELVENLKTWPQYYLSVRGHAASNDDMELAEARAKATMDYLAQKNVNRNRMRTESKQSDGSTTVSFILGELPY